MLDAERLVERHAAFRIGRVGAVAEIVVIAHIRGQQIAPAGRAGENIEVERAERLESGTKRRVRQKIVVAGLERLTQVPPDRDVSRERPGGANAQAQRSHANQSLHNAAVLSGRPATWPSISFKQASLG